MSDVVAGEGDGVDALTSSLAAAYTRELEGYERTGRAERAAQVRKALAELGITVPNPAPAPRRRNGMRDTVNRTPRHMTRGTEGER